MQRGTKHTDASKRKIRKSLKGRIHTKARITNMKKGLKRYHARKKELQN